MLTPTDKELSKHTKKNPKYLLGLILFAGLIGLTLFLLSLPIIFLGDQLMAFWLKRPDTSFPLDLKWQADLGDFSYESPIYQKGLLLFPADVTESYWSGQTHYWYSLDAETGQIIWSQKVNRGYNFLRCLTSDQMIVSGPWSLLALQPQTGEILWQKEKGARVTCSKDSVFASVAPRDSIHALNIATGQRRWNITDPLISFSSFIYNPDANELIASETTLPGDYYVIEPSSGKIKRSFQDAGRSPLNVWQRGVIYVVSDNHLLNGGTVIDTQTGQVIHSEERYALFPPTLTDETMYLSTTEEGIVAIDREKYEVQWRYHPSSLPLFKGVSLVPLTQMAISGNIGYVIFSDATLRAFDLETGQELGYWQPDKETLSQWPFACLRFPGRDECIQSAIVGLTAANDMVYVSFGDGKLYAFEPQQ